MGAAELIPWQETIILADRCAELWGYSTDYWLRIVACKPGFPQRGGAGWRVGTVRRWRRRVSGKSYPDSLNPKRWRRMAGTTVQS